jgi:4-hydroxybenzoate polyprenyltransferase
MGKVLLELARVSNLPTVWTNCLAAWVLAGGTWETRLAWLLLAASLIYSAGMMLNDAADAAWDSQHKKERPIPSARITATTVWWLGGTLMLSGAALSVWPGGADWRWTTALVLAVLTYDCYHKPWSGSVLIMGLCRTFLCGLVASAAGGMTPAGWVHGTALGVYVIALSLVARGEARGTLTPGTRWLLRLGLCAPILAPATSGPGGWLVPGCALVLLVLTAGRQMARGGKDIGEAVGWLLAGMPLVDALNLPPAQWPMAWAFVLLVPGLKVWQRFVAAT